MYIPSLTLESGMDKIKSLVVRTLVLPKIHTHEDLRYVAETVRNALIREISRNHSSHPIHIIASIESAAAAWNLGDIASWKAEDGPELGGRLSALLVSIVQS